MSQVRRSRRSLDNARKWRAVVTTRGLDRMVWHHGDSLTHGVSGRGGRGGQCFNSDADAMPSLLLWNVYMNPCSCSSRVTRRTAAVNLEGSVKIAERERSHRSLPPRERAYCRLFAKARLFIVIVLLPPSWTTAAANTRHYPCLPYTYGAEDHPSPL